MKQNMTETMNLVYEGKSKKYFWMPTALRPDMLMYH